MAQSPVKKVEHFAVGRVTAKSPKLYDDVLEAIYSSIGRPDGGERLKAIMQAVLGSPNADGFIDTVEKFVGLHDFMFFQEFNHGVWIPLFGVGNGLKSKRIILGNPLIAITMIKRDLTAGLSVPVEIMVMEKETGGTEIIYNLPSGLIAGLNRDAELLEAVGVLDQKLEAFVTFVLT